MCKVMMMAGIKPANATNAVKFTKTMASIISKNNDDGLGYMAMDKNGDIFGERWLYNDTAWTTQAPVDSEMKRLAKQWPGLVNEPAPIPFEYTSFGVKGTPVAIALHARFATTTHGMNNTHPFVTPNNKLGLIHNGVINNHMDFRKTLSTCDSEAILVGYDEENVIEDMNNIQGLADRLRGYYACAVLSNITTPTLDVFRANGANLSMAYVTELDTFVLTTQGADITTACKILGFTHETILEVKDETLIRIDPISGKLIDIKKFQSAPRYEYKPPVTSSRSTTPAYMGGWEYNPVTGSSKQVMSPAMISYMKNAPEISKMSTAEMQEFIFSRESLT